MTLAVGKQKIFQAYEEIGKSLIRRFASVIGDNNPVYRDEKLARQSRYRGIIAPPTLVFELGYDVGEGIDEESGLQQGLLEWFDNPKSTGRVLNQYEIYQPVRPDDILTVKREMIDVTEKEGKAGRWTFITSKVTFVNQKGELLGINTETLACQY